MTRLTLDFPYNRTLSYDEECELIQNVVGALRYAYNSAEGLSPSTPESFYESGTLVEDEDADTELVLTHINVSSTQVPDEEFEL